MKKRGKEGFKQDIEKLVGNEYSVIDKIYDKEKKLTTYKIKHNSCGREYVTTRYKFVKRGDRCKECSIYSKKDTAWFKEKVNKITNSKYSVIGEYIDTKTKVNIKHNICGFEYLVSPNKFLSGRRCPSCSHPFKIKTSEEFQNEINIITNNEFQLLSEYVGRKEIVSIKHLNCGNSFEVKPGNFLKTPTCKICEQKSSKGEYYINEFLQNYNIDFKRQFRIKDCKDKRSLPFDFAIFKNNKLVFLIEYNGRQHYNSKSIYSKNFEDRKKKDKIKADYCKNNNINLLTIPYWDFKNLNKIITEKVKEYNLI